MLQAYLKDLDNLIAYLKFASEELLALNEELKESEVVDNERD